MGTLVLCDCSDGGHCPLMETSNLSAFCFPSLSSNFYPVLPLTCAPLAYAFISVVVTIIIQRIIRTILFDCCECPLLTIFSPVRHLSFLSLPSILSLPTIFMFYVPSPATTGQCGVSLPSLSLSPPPPLAFLTLSFLSSYIFLSFSYL